MGSAPTRWLPYTLKVFTAHIVDISAGSEPRMFAWARLLRWKQSIDRGRTHISTDEISTDEIEISTERTRTKMQEQRVHCRTHMATICVLSSPHVPVHEHGATRLPAHFVQAVPAVPSNVLIQALHWSAGSSAESPPVQFVAPTPGHDDCPAVLTIWNFPAGHTAQAVSPSGLLNFPAGHLMQLTLSASGWYCPAAHAVHELAAVPLNLPSGQERQKVETVMGMYFPAGQSVHF